MTHADKLGQFAKATGNFISAYTNLSEAMEDRQNLSRFAPGIAFPDLLMFGCGMFCYGDYQELTRVKLIGVSWEKPLYVVVDLEPAQI